MSGYETLVDYSITNGEEVTSSADGCGELAPTRTGDPEYCRRFLRYPDDVLYHFLDDHRRHVYGRICKEYDGLFESGKSDSRFCSRRCQRASKYVSLQDKADVESMLAAGCSYKEIGERYGASESIAASYVNAVIRHVSKEEARKQAWSAKRSETNSCT